MIQTKTFAIIGSGNMAEALIRGLVQPAGVVPSEHILAADIVEPRLKDLRDRYGIQTFTKNTPPVRQAEIVILAVKPQVMPTVLSEIAEEVDEHKLVISIAAGVPISTIQERLRPTRVIRVMPNIAALVHAAMTAISRGQHATDQDVQLAQAIFQAVGETVVVEEKLMDTVTGLSGSGPAYVFHIIQALADGGVKMGCPRDVALKLAVQTVYGAAKMQIETGEHPIKLRDMVTSPGGTSITGIYALEQDGLSAALMHAVEAATLRSQELGGATKQK